MSNTAITVILHHPDAMEGQARTAMLSQVIPAVNAMFSRGVQRVKLTADEDEDDRSERQHRYYWGVVLRDVSEHVSVGGQKYTKDAWHEYGKRTFLPRKTKKVKVAGRSRPVVTTVIASTTDLSVRQFGNYLERWMAFAAEHGVTVSEALPPELRGKQKARERIDADTGEILEAA